MQIQLEPPGCDHFIRHLESDDDGLRITTRDKTYRESVIISPLTLQLWRVKTVSNLTERDFDAILEWEVEVVLIGTGSRIIFPPPGVYRSLVEKGIGVEIMDTPAAARTYNILASDGRKVVAMLIL